MSDSVDKPSFGLLSPLAPFFSLPFFVLCLPLSSIHSGDDGVARSAVVGLPSSSCACPVADGMEDEIESKQNEFVLLRLFPARVALALLQVLKRMKSKKAKR